MKRLIVILVVVLFGVCAYYLYLRHGAVDSTPVAATASPPGPGPTPTLSAVATSTPTCCNFGPDSPLLAPAAVSSGPEEERAIMLAQQVLAGGEGTLPALVAALQQAGFPIRDANGEIVIKPIGKSQGIVFQVWEVNALAEFFANRKQMTVPLDNFAEMLASPLRELQGVPMTDLLLDGVRHHARDENGSTLFWAAFIVELGRQNPVHEPYDLLFDIDPAKTQLDVLQIALITKRLAADVAVLAFPEKAGKKLAFRLPSWPVRTVHAAELPCRQEGIESEVADWMATGTGLVFDKLFGYLIETKEVAGAEALSNALAFANIVLAYGKLAVAQSAFDIKFEMQGGTPLVRTQEKGPRTGERKTIVATISMDMSKHQWINCFRILFNQMGLDFNVENDGPIEGASLSWSGESGFGGELVQYVGDAANRIQSEGGRTASQVLDARTDKSGRATVDVEGVGQRQDLRRDPKPVMKEATAVAMAVLKPANLYNDFKDAVAVALSGVGGLLIVPADLMYRTRWSFGGSYTFPVKDWKPGNDAWTGTIIDTIVKRQIVEKTVDSKCCGGRPITSKHNEFAMESVQQHWEITSNADAEALTPEFATMRASYSVNASLTSNLTYKRTGWNSCKGGREATWSENTRTEKASASQRGQADVGINIGPDGSYSIATGGPGELPSGDRKTTSVLTSGPNCGVSSKPRRHEKTTSYVPRLGSAAIEGKVRPDHEDELSGTKIEIEKDPRVGIIITHTCTWTLNR